MTASPIAAENTMRAVLYDNRLRLVTDRGQPIPPPGWVQIRVHTAGICQTDLELMKGYMAFSGVLGHEFVGTVTAADDPRWQGRRVVGDINAACGGCGACRSGLGRHCPNRSVLGIAGLDGCMADYCTLPRSNLNGVPDAVSDDRAVFCEPLAAACEILDQVAFTGSERVVVMGDGRLGILCAWVLTTVAGEVTLVGHHDEKLATAAWNGLKTRNGSAGIPTGADVVVEATGAAGGLQEAMALCRPRGTLVMKSTVAATTALNLAPLVVNELTVVGSRCGRLAEGLKMMETHPDMPLERLITARFPVARALEAFALARSPNTLKVLIDFKRTPIP
ncbi:MAG: alcohol dehydrogenase catalytic domain-containing protein [Pseudomonadota bacterium]